MERYSDWGIDIPQSKISGQISTICPKCSKERKKKNVKCLGVNLDLQVWRCNHCGWSGKLRQNFQKKVYQKPKYENKTNLSDNLVSWFKTRNLAQNTLLEARISEGGMFIPTKGRKCNTCQFLYFRENELVNIKYRTADKHFVFYKDAELIFYNLNSIKDTDECYIVEGEIDALSLIECGFKNVVSVPNGANLNKNNLEYIDNCIEYFINKKRIHIAVDNDIAGRKLREDLSLRFGKDVCDYIEFGDYKDANDVLVNEGKGKLMDYLIDFKQFPIEGAFTISDISNDINDLYDFGLDKGVSLEIPEFDLNIVKGYITTITGIPSHGKSEWVDYMCIRARQLNDWNGAFYSPENKPTQLHFAKMARKIIGKHWDGGNRMTKDEVQMVKDYLDKKMFFIKPEKDFTLKSILQTTRELQQRYGIDYFVIDAWNKLEHKESDTAYIGRSLDELGMFCELNQIHCFLVAHPAKMPKDKDGKFEIPTMYSISGSANFFNKTDNGISVYRDKEKGITTIYRQKVKFDHWGSEGHSDYYYHFDSKRYYALGKEIDLSNWITGQKEQLKQSPIPSWGKMNNETAWEKYEQKIDELPF